MSDMIAFNLQISPDLNRTILDIARDAGTDMSSVLHQALALMSVAHAAKKEGRHLGIVSEASRLDTEIVGLL